MKEKLKIPTLLLYIKYKHTLRINYINTRITKSALFKFKNIK